MLARDTPFSDLERLFEQVCDLAFREHWIFFFFFEFFSVSQNYKRWIACHNLWWCFEEECAMNIIDHLLDKVLSGREKQQMDHLLTTVIVRCCSSATRTRCIASLLGSSSSWSTWLFSFNWRHWCLFFFIIIIIILKKIRLTIVNVFKTISRWYWKLPLMIHQVASSGVDNFYQKGNY